MFGFSIGDEFTAANRETEIEDAKKARWILLGKCGADTETIFISGLESIKADVPLIIQQAYECIVALEKRIADLEYEVQSLRDGDD
jgi:RIO-like serine/threonine protein kinase